jgi:hypothetical protein
MVFVVAPALFAWAIVTITRAGSNVPTTDDYHRRE